MPNKVASAGRDTVPEAVSPAVDGVTLYHQIDGHAGLGVTVGVTVSVG